MAWTSDTLDVLTETEAKAAVGVQGAHHEAALSVVNAGVRRRLERLVGPIVRRTVTDEAHDAAPVIILRRRPVVRASVVVTATATATAIDADLLTLGAWAGVDDGGELAAGRIQYRGGYRRTLPDVEVSYTAGRYASTAEVDPLFKEAARLMLRNLWRSETPGIGAVGEYDVPAANWPGYAVPNAVRDLLAGELVEAPVVA